MKLAIYGTGGSGSETYDIVRECEQKKEEWSEIIFIDDTKNVGIYNDCKMMPFDEFKMKYSCEEVVVVIAIGEPSVREILYNRVTGAGYTLANIIHPGVKISPSAKLGMGIVLQDGVLVSSNAIIEDNVYINHRSIIGHDVHIGRHCQMSANIVMAGTSQLGEGSFVGVNCCVRERTKIGNNAIVSMGTVVLKDVPPFSTVMGNPGRVISNGEGRKVFG